MNHKIEETLRSNGRVRSGVALMGGFLEQVLGIPSVPPWFGRMR